ncbi:MAG: hypothetical protein MMC33_008576 [Icmadophila ericetorum]|nr:hypothetical protein [Icmadophila ericetorum]
MVSSLVLEDLKGWHQDLLSFSDEQIANIERLLSDLEQHIEEFKVLLDKPIRNDQSRSKVSSGTIELEEQQYSLNAEFQDQTFQLADALDLDEVKAAQLLLAAQEEAEMLDRSALATAVIRFQEKRQFTLECIRLMLHLSLDQGRDERVRDAFSSLARRLMTMENNAARFSQRCLSELAHIERWLQNLAERSQRNRTLGQSTSVEFDEMVEFQQQSLTSQHESLAAISTQLVKATDAETGDFRRLLDHMSTLDRWNVVALHYVPILISFTSHFGTSEAYISLQEARALHTTITGNRETRPWGVPQLQAALVTWWLAEYNSWFLEPLATNELVGVDLEAEARGHSDAFIQALRDGAFHCTLSISSQIRPNDWYDPSRKGLTDFLLDEAPMLPSEATLITTYFRDLVLEQLQNFSEAFITNMPDTLRKFKVEEDDQRRRIFSTAQPNMQNILPEHDLHLERFLLIMSYAYDGYPDAAEHFWGDTEGNLYGFLQWASRRQSTPRASTFCEMFRAISGTNEWGTAAHRFLLEEVTNTPGRLRRSSCLSWSQIFGELDFFASKVRENPAAVLPASKFGATTKPIDIDEPESAMMLECYLRLTTHLCIQSEVIRLWITNHESFRIFDVLFMLCTGTVPKRIRACAYDTMRAMLTDKEADLSNNVWLMLDHWISGNFSPAASLTRTARMGNPPGRTDDVTFDMIASDFEEANAFVALLQALVNPALEHVGLHDALPFPEQLGSASRMPGIEPYVDLVLGSIGANRMGQLYEPLQIRILSYNVLNFAGTCLSTFNEDLLVLANKTSIAVDKTMTTTSLVTYVRLHPFGRVMEWMFNERVIATLFHIAHQDIAEVNTALPTSPLVLALLKSIEVMSLILDLQTTYLNIVRPLIKTQPGFKNQSVFNPALTSFEDSVASNLRIIVDLSLYCGSGHQDLVLFSLVLLEKLASSRKLNAPSRTLPGLGIMTNPLIDILERDSDLEPVSRSLTFAMDFDARELSYGSDAPGYKIKSRILEFLEHTLTAVSERPNLAHALLGFSARAGSLSIDDAGTFSREVSLFHAILRLAAAYPESIGGVYLSWTLSLKRKALEILHTLWSSPLTSRPILSEIRDSEFIYFECLSQTLIDTNIIWDSRPLGDPQFIFGDSAVALEHYLRQRCLFFEHASIELRFVAREGTPSQKKRLLPALLGTTTTDDGEQHPNLSVVDLLDFMNLELAEPREPPAIHFFEGVDFNISFGALFDDAIQFYDLKAVEELLALRHNELRKMDRLPEETQETALLKEAHSIIVFFKGENNYRQLEVARMAALVAWVDLVTLIVQSGLISRQNKSSIILQALQILAPKLEYFSNLVRPEAQIFAKAIGTLLAHLDKRLSSQTNGDIEPKQEELTTLEPESRSPTLEVGRAAEFVNDRLFHIFRIALRAIHVPNGDTLLRETLYEICYRYLTCLVNPMSTATHYQYAIQAVRSAGDTLVDTITDDAYAGEGNCRITALLLLNALTGLVIGENSTFMIDSLVRTNFIVVLVESIRDIPDELRQADPTDISLLFSYYKIKFALLLTISQTRAGASQVMNAGFFTSVRGSKLFLIDPDLGTDVDNLQALQRYHSLLLYALRIVTALVLSRGPHNTFTLGQARHFLDENRVVMVAMFKRQARIGSLLNGDVGEGVVGDVIAELVENYVLLISLTGFLEYEEERDTQLAIPRTKFS